MTFPRKLQVKLENETQNRKSRSSLRMQKAFRLHLTAFTRGSLMAFGTLESAIANTVNSARNLWLNYTLYGRGVDMEYVEC